MTLVALIALGGIVALDATSFGQLLLSRPFVAATLAGAIVGMPLEGALVGAMLDILSLSILPVGAARYPDTGTSAVAAVGSLGLADVEVSAPALLLVVAYGLMWQRIAGASVVGGRYLNERLVRAGREGRSARLDRIIEHGHIESMVLEVLRGTAITSIALVAGALLLPPVLNYWDLPPVVATIGTATAVTAVLAGTASLFAETRRGRLFLVLGLIVGSTVMVIL